MKSNACFMAFDVAQMKIVDLCIVQSNILLLRMRMSVIGHQGLF